MLIELILGITESKIDIAFIQMPLIMESENRFKILLTII